MGCWGYQILCDDIALDAVSDLLESDEPEQSVADFLNGLIEDPGEYDAEQYALVAAASVDATLNGMDSTIWDECDDNEDLEALAELLNRLQLSPLRRQAVIALKLILSENSELRQLWEENGELYPLWEKNVSSMLSRLEND
ncbi:MAG: DUF4259 domain-containing protein [Butyricicoccaceae bacterium]